MPLADRARSLFNSVSVSVSSLPAVPSVPYPSTLIKRAGFATSGGGKGSPPPPLAAGGGGQPNGWLGVGGTGANGGGTLKGEVKNDTAAGFERQRAVANDGNDGVGGDTDTSNSASSSDAVTATTTTTTAAEAATGGGDGDAASEDETSGDDVAFTLEAVRTSLDAREMAAMGQSLDALEEIPTLSLDDFLRPAFMNTGANSGHGSDAGTSAPPSQPDTPRLADASAASHYDADTDLEVPEEVDPRVGDALDELNNSMTDVNILETELSAARRRR